MSFYLCHLGNDRTEIEKNCGKRNDLGSWVIRCWSLVWSLRSTTPKPLWLGRRSMTSILSKQGLLGLLIKYLLLIFGFQEHPDHKNKNRPSFGAQSKIWMRSSNKVNCSMVVIDWEWTTYHFSNFEYNIAIFFIIKFFNYSWQYQIYPWW